MIRGLHLNHPGMRDPLTTVLEMLQVVGDGYGWRSLSTEWDYSATRRRVCETIFPKESQRVYGANAVPGVSISDVPREGPGKEVNSGE